MTFHPAKNQPIKAALLAFALGTLGQFLWNTVGPGLACLLWVILLVSLRDFFLETRYEFEADGFSVYGPLRKPQHYSWQRFRAFVEDRNGVFMTPYVRARITENQRGVFLPLTPEQRARVCELCVERALLRREP